MEINLNEPVHIEFYGLPGCGKSTVSHMAAEQLRKQGFKVYEPSYKSDHNLHPVCRKLYKLSATVFFCFGSYRDYQILRGLIKRNGCTKFKNYVKQMVNIIPKIKFYRTSRQAIFLWDEGLVQSAISLALCSNTNIQHIEKELFCIAGRRKIVKVYLKSDIETAMQRMAGRNSNDSRVEQEPDERKKRAIMERFEACCEQIDNSQAYITKADIENIWKIVGFVRKQIKEM